MSPLDRVAVVTGGNKGIGYAIIRKMALDYPKSKLNTGGQLHLYLTGRDSKRRRAAKELLRNDPVLVKAKVLHREGGPVQPRLAELDVTSEERIDKFEELLTSKHKRGIDVFVNNAGVSLDGFDSDIVRRTLATNYHACISLTKRFLPHLRENGRLINMASMLGKLNNKYTPEVTEIFKWALATESTQTIDDVMAKYQDAVDRNAAEQEGWPTSPYAVSKSGVIAATRALARKERQANPDKGVTVNSCCPGYVSTDMTKQRGRKTPEEGAATPVHLALGHPLPGIVTGEFWENEEVSSWY